MLPALGAAVLGNVLLFTTYSPTFDLVIQCCYYPSHRNNEPEIDMVIYIVTYKSLANGKKEKRYFSNSDTAFKWRDEMNGTIECAVLFKD